MAQNTIGNPAEEFVYSNINFDEPMPFANRRETMFGLIITFLFLSWACCSLRLYTRLVIVRAAWWDDFFVALYLITTTAGCIAICVSVQFGFGQHILKLEHWQVQSFLKAFYVCNATYVTSTTLIKLALLFQFVRIFQRGTRTRAFVVGLIVFTSLWGTAYAIMAWMPCIPVAAFWHPFEPEYGVCYGFGSTHPKPFVATFESHTAINMILDIIVLTIPVPLMWRERNSLPARLRLMGLLTMGSIVIVLASWRLQTIVGHQVATWPTRDPTWYGPISILLAALEVLAASICASVPIFWPVVTNSWGKIFVTKEIQVTSESRFGDEVDTAILTGHQHSRSGSDGDLSRSDRAKTGHYRDSYILRQVDPLRKSVERVQVSASQGGNPESDSRKWVRI